MWKETDEFLEDMPDLLIPDKKEQEHLIQEHHVERHRVRLLSYFCLHPDGLDFESKGEKETILLFLRRHWITNVSWMLTTLLASVLPLLFHILLKDLNYPLDIPTRYVTFFVLFYYLLVFCYSFLNFITWFYNISLVTDDRLVDIDYSDLVYRHVSATKLEFIEDVSYVQVGVFRSIFDYGNLMIQTAGTVDNFQFDQAPHPEDVIKIVESLIGRKR